MGQLYFSGSLPDGRETMNPHEYLEKWNSFLEPFQKLTGMHCTSYDPGAVFRSKDHVTVDIPTSVLKLINEGLEKIQNDKS